MGNLSGAAPPRLGRPDIGVSYIDELPVQPVREFTEAIAAPRLRVAAESRESAVFAGLEWLLPTAIVVFIARSYFDSFFKEMGKDHYNILKAALKNLGAHASGIKTTRLGSKGKLRADPVYSSTISVVAEIGSGLRLKFLVRDNYSDVDFSRLVEEALDLLIDVFGGTILEPMASALNDARVVSGTILLGQDPLTGRLKVLDPLPAKVDSRLQPD